MIEDLGHRIVEERNNYARIHGTSEHDVNAKIGVAMEEIRDRQASQCFRFLDPATYPTRNVIYGTTTPVVFAKNRGQILLHGVDSNGKAAVVEAHSARFNFSRQKVKLNHQDTADDCDVGNGEPYSVTNPASIYIRFVRADLEHSKTEPIMAAFSQWTAAMRRNARLTAAAVILQGDATGGDEAKGDEQASLEVLTHRKETLKKKKCVGWLGAEA